MTSPDQDPFTTPEALTFRADLRRWLERELPPGWGTEAFAGPVGEAAEVAFLRDWQGRLHAAGLAGLSWPERYGGAGASIVEQVIFAEERDRARAPIDIGIVGTQMVGPMLMAHGTEDQRTRHLPRILSGEDLWCQGFSEPGAGSDLAALSTRARPVADGWQIDGQKLWTSRAQYADQMILLARTDPDARPHRGITAFVVPLDAEGLTIRPIRQVNGSTEFCEVFLHEVTVGADAVVGAVDDGWSVAISTLSFERLATTRAFEMRRLVSDLVLAHPDLVAAGGPGSWTPLADEITGHVIDAHAAGLAFSRLVTAIARHGDVGVDASATKLSTTELGQRIVATAMTSLPDAASRPVVPRLGGPVSWTLELTNGLKNTIAAGTSQIQRNIVGERVLGLPRPGATRPPAAAAEGPGPRPFRDASLPQEQQEFLATVRQALARSFPAEAAIEAAEDPAAFAGGDDLWALLGDLGCSGLHLLGLAVAEAGHALLPGSLLGHALALRHLVHPRDPAAATLAVELAGGRRRATVGGARDHDAATLVLHDDGRVSGRVEGVFEPRGAQVLVAPARRGDRPAVVAVPVEHPAVELAEVAWYDPTRRFGTLGYHELPAEEVTVMAVGDDADHARHGAALDGAVLVACDSLGSARRTLDDAIAYAGERHQFGAPIGSFQAIKHLLVDAHVRVEDARAAVGHAAASIDEGGHGPFAVHAAKALAASAHDEVAAAAVQVFGGIGFTREVTAHLHLKRARVNEHLYGAAPTHRRRAARYLAEELASWTTVPMGATDLTPTPS